MNAREAAQVYIDRGWYPVPLVTGTKACRDKDWMTRVYSPEDFSEIDNIGLRLVSSADELRSLKLIGVDLDSDEAVASAESFLPESASWGRASKKISQVLFESPFDKEVVFKDYAGDKKPTLLEIRVNHQSMAPPSIHPSGEELFWIKDIDKALKIEKEDLLRRCKLIATSAMMSRYYASPGERHDWTLAMTGTLRRLGVTEEECSSLFKASANFAGDQKVNDRLTEVHSTFSRAEDDPTTGSNALAQQMPTNGLKFVETLRRIWGSGTDFIVNDKSGRTVQSNPDNIRSALSKMDVVLGENVFAKRFCVKSASGWRYLDDEVLDKLFLTIHSKFQFLPSRDLFDTVIRDTARNTKFHPVLEYLDSLKWDEKKRVSSWLIDHGGAADSEYCREVGKIVLVAAVRRVRQEGCKFDEMLVLESGQGLNKSTMLRALCPNPEWFSDDLPLGVDAKQIIERTSGKWIIEAAELMNMRRAQVEQLKASLSRQVDGPVRLAYGRASTEVPRKFIIIGTTNSATYLKDDTGNRRFWPVKVKTFNVETVLENRDQLWAEASRLEADGESIRLPSSLWTVAGTQQERRRKEDPWESVLYSALADIGDGPQQRIEPSQVWKILGIGVADMNEINNERIHRIMGQLGFRRITMRKGKSVVRGWGRDLVGGIFRPAGWDKDE